MVELARGLLADNAETSPRAARSTRGAADVRQWTGRRVGDARRSRRGGRRRLRRRLLRGLPLLAALAGGVAFGVLLGLGAGVLVVGAWAVAPLAGEWIHFAALANKTAIALDVLRDTVAQFPTFSEAFLRGLEALDA